MSSKKRLVPPSTHLACGRPRVHVYVARSGWNRIAGPLRSTSLRLPVLIYLSSNSGLPDLRDLRIIDVRLGVATRIRPVAAGGARRMCVNRTRESARLRRH
jgi:hypothetical protein